MKKFLPGIIAVLLGAACFAFTEFSKPGKKLKQKGDWCAENTKQWFMYTWQSCGHRGIAPLRDYHNYKKSNTDSVTAYCQGSTCVCSILACPQMYPNQDYPDIGATTDIYTHLYNFYFYGMTYGDITLKDDQ